tara:strand:- start:168 stop:1160 length:993 start_codon:yes stop_codon:yes gene_type:complete
MSGFTLSGLGTFTVEDKAGLKRKSVYGAVSMDLFTIYEGIKYSEKLPYLTTQPAMQAYATCASINPSGDGGTLAQITLTVDTFSFQDSWCLRQLEIKYAQKYLKKGTNYDENSAPELINAILEDYSARQAKIYEMAVWQSSKTQNVFNTNLKQFNGFIQTLTTLGGFVNQQTVAGTAYTSITTANVLTILDNQWLATPADIKRSDDLVTCMGDDTFDKMIIALKNANNYNWTATSADAGSRSITYPGTTMKIVAVPGLNADNDSNLPAAFKNRIITFQKDNYIVGTDLISDENDIDMWYEKKEDLIYYRNIMKMTTGIFFPEFTVSFATV